MKKSSVPSGIVILILSFSLFISCGRKVEPRNDQESPGLREQSRPAAEASHDARGVAKEKSTNDQHAYLELTLHNSTGGMIDETAITFGGRSCTFGIVGKEASAGYLGWDQPVGINGVVRWRDSGKSQREAQVDISKVYDRTVPGNLTFTIVGTNLTVKFEKVDRK